MSEDQITPDTATEEAEIIVATDNQGNKHEFPREQYRDRRSGYGIHITEGKVLLALDKNSKKWELPGGKADTGESREDAMRREFTDETGLDVEGEVKPVTTIREYYYDTRLPFPYRHERSFFLITATGGRLHNEGNSYDIEQCEYIPLDQLDKMPITDTVKQAISEARKLA
ncbi:MAG: hydrolase [Candidatus Saccharibacteria bacterium]|jgi:8-oxo-dGTP pyrophosphatase MutT (NUDIX family)|nr:hydrolase [Candidatus Saccharibacteria bacterium]